jgi:uncharacterized OsmC-like protein
MALALYLESASGIPKIRAIHANDVLGRSGAQGAVAEGGPMQPLPHYYNVTVAAGEKGPTEITSPGLDPLISAPPREFDGPGNLWSPETFVVAAVGDCLVLTFRAIAKVAKISWTNVVCDATGVVDRLEGITRFTEVRLHVRLSVPFGADAEKARQVLEKAEKACLVGNSLKCEPTIDAEVIVEQPALAPTA